MSNKKELITEYLNQHINNIISDDLIDKLVEASNLIQSAKRNGNKVLFFGNGASAAIASHAALDFTKQAKVRSFAFNDGALLTAFSNDFGYDRWVENAIIFYGDKGDIGVFISSSGKSKNIIQGAFKAKENGMTVITFSGFNSDNPLSKIGDINFWIDSKAYNVIENVHQIWLMGICDLIIGKLEYPVS